MANPLARRTRHDHYTGIQQLRIVELQMGLPPEQAREQLLYRHVDPFEGCLEALPGFPVDLAHRASNVVSASIKSWCWASKHVYVPTAAQILQ
ncbi:MAG: hypothetical protein R3F37_03075 [Candidatus Competibacteraceae bacterium]